MLSFLVRNCDFAQVNTFSTFHFPHLWKWRPSNHLTGLLWGHNSNAMIHMMYWYTTGIQQGAATISVFIINNGSTTWASSSGWYDASVSDPKICWPSCQPGLEPCPNFCVSFLSFANPPHTPYTHPQAEPAFYPCQQYCCPLPSSHPPPSPATGCISVVDEIIKMMLMPLAF